MHVLLHRMLHLLIMLGMRLEELLLRHVLLSVMMMMMMMIGTGTLLWLLHVSSGGEVIRTNKLRRVLLSRRWKHAVRIGRVRAHSSLVVLLARQVLSRPV